MTLYWMMTPYDASYPDIFDAYWAYDLGHRVIALGWDVLGDVSRMTEAQLRDRIVQTQTQHGNDLGYVSRMFRYFYREITPGDVVVARRGLHKVIGIGVVTKAGFYNEKMGNERAANLTNAYIYPNFIGVDWQTRDITSPKQFTQYAIFKLSEERYRSLVKSRG